MSAPTRRTVVAGAFVVGAAAGTAGCDLGSFGGSGARTGTATARPGHRRGPTAADWRTLDRHLDGAVVLPHDSDYDDVRELFDPRFDHVHPRAVVEVTSAEDVSTAIDFARRFDLRVRAKAGGHSYVGASSVTGGMVIDVGRIAQVRYDASSRLATVGAGARLYDVHARLAKHGRTIPTGTCPTVGAAGLTLGGGIGVASRASGLTCDQLAGVTIVTAAGDVVIASHRHHPDLFWACRGGGGGNFGVVTSLRYATQPTASTGFFLQTFPWRHAPRVITGWARRVRAMSASGWANLHVEAGADGSTSVRTVGVCRAGDEDAEASAMEAEVGIAATSTSTFEKSYLDGVVFLGGGTTSPRTTFAAGSDVLAHLPHRLAGTLAHVIGERARSRQAAVAILDPLTGAVADVARDATAFAWRRHLCDIQWYVGLPTGADRSVVAAAYDWIGSAHQAIRGHSVGGYVNYAEPGRAVSDYYGPNYPRLRRIKHQVDPDGFFTGPLAIA